MAEQRPEFSPAETATARLKNFLKSLGDQGISQAQVADRAGIPPQYLSDLKQARRPMTELVARRLGDEFNTNFKWLLGIEASMHRPSAGSWIPIFHNPIEGQPRAHPDWDGSGLEVAGVAAVKLAIAEWPYIVRFEHNDTQGRICQGDLVLISQLTNPKAEISVVRYRNKCFLTRPNKTHTSWVRVATGAKLPADCPVVGHCLGIVWAPLC